MACGCRVLVLGAWERPSKKSEIYVDLGPGSSKNTHMKITNDIKLSRSNIREIELCADLELRRRGFCAIDLLLEIETRSGAANYTIGMKRDEAGAWLYITRLYLERLDREEQEVSA